MGRQRTTRREKGGAEGAAQGELEIYCGPPTAMNAVLAIIADDGRSIIVIDREAVEIKYILLYFIDSAKTL